MTDFASAPAALPRVAPLDPTKHVKYTLGMVLGVDDFDQEFAYLSGRDRWLARELSGYGTVWGLRLGVEVEDRGPRVNVAPGVAVTPCGQLVCVTPAQCAYVNDWLAAHEQEARQLLDSPPQTALPLYVVLCYRECATDDVPIPGEPCRTEDTLQAPSRVKDDFRLELRMQPPPQPEEDAIRDFVAWLREIPVVAGFGSPLADLLIAIRSAAEVAIHGLESPPSSPPLSPPEGPLDFLLGSPPPGLEIPAAEAPEYFRAALLLWVTELRPALRHALPGCEKAPPGTCGCGCEGATGTAVEPCAEDVVLLGTIDFPIESTLEGGLLASASGWTIDETRRPYLLESRLLQELILGGGLFAEGGFFPGGSPLEAQALGPPISGVSAHPVAGNPTADWTPATRELDLGIPAGPQGQAGAGVTNVTTTPLAFNAAPTASLQNGVLNLGIPAGQPGQPGEPGSAFVVAAGTFGPRGGRVERGLGNLDAEPVRGSPGLFILTFDAFERGNTYAVIGSPLTSVGQIAHTFEQVVEDDALRAALAAAAPAPEPGTGIFVRVIGNDLKTAAAGFSVEISDFSRGR
jgi:hypothetical protein